MSQNLHSLESTNIHYGLRSRGGWIFIYSSWFENGKPKRIIGWLKFQTISQIEWNNLTNQHATSLVHTTTLFHKQRTCWHGTQPSTISVGSAYHNNYQASSDVTFYWVPLRRLHILPWCWATDGEYYHKIMNDPGSYRKGIKKDLKLFTIDRDIIWILNDIK